LNEISRIADSITVLRDGATIETLNVREDHITEDRIIKGMVGRELTDRYPKRDAAIGDTIFEIKNWNVYHHLHSERKVIHDINFYVRQGEVVGIAGLMGAGRTELAMSIFGRSYGQKISGQIYKNGTEIQLKNVSQAIDQGVAYVTEDRKQYGLILNDDIKKNITLANLKSIAKNSVIDENEEILVAEKSRQQMNIKCSSILQNTVNLSGGNQQKVILSKWIFTEPDILILDEPTRGIDVGAKFEIYSIINNLVKDGKGIVLISSELTEILGMCDRIYVMSEGKITGELTGQEASQERIMKYVMSK
jgi:putative multiple sugar transport system ATP-binding protein